MATEKKELSFQELMEHLKDPALLQAAATKFGFKLAPAQEQKPKKEQKPLELEAIPDDADMPTLIRALNKNLSQVFTHVDTRLNDTVETARQEVVRSKEDQTKEQIRKFAKEHKDFEELIPMIEPFFATGKYSIEEAYELGRKASGKSGKETPGKNTDDVPPRQAKSSENGDTDLEKAKKPLSIREAAKKNLETILAKPEFAGEQDVIGEKDEI